MSGVTRVVATGIVKRFGATVALRGVSVVLEPGLTLVLGANGSGKSTLLGVLGTTVRPSAGEVRYEPFGADRAEARRHIGWVSHETMAYGDLSGRRNLELAAEIYGLDPRATWEQARERFELGAFAERPVRTNSRGQRQRIALARALLHGPSVILLDEPTTGLDRAGVKRLLGIVDEEIRRGCVLAVVEHDPEVFRALARGEVQLERGRLAEVPRETSARLES